MTFAILDAGDPVERAAWISRWDAGRREPSAHPAYATLFAAPDERALAAVYEDDGGRVLFPFLLRPVPGSGGALVDVMTPYGYGGPFRDGAPHADGFWDAFDAWAGDMRVTALTARLSLFAEELVAFRGAVVHVMDNVVCDVARPIDAIFASYEHKVRKNVKRAEREGLRVEIERTPARFEDFHRIYRATMARRSAAESFYFPRAFFDAIHAQLPDSYVYAHVLHGSVVISTELILAATDHLYSFLGGTDEAYFSMRPNDLLKHAVIAWGSRHGHRRYVLGGGRSAGDDLFRYKRSFAPSGGMPFLIGHRVYRDADYHRLVEERRAAEARAGRAWSPAPSYFPAYRAP